MDKKLIGTEWTVRLRGGAGGWRGDKDHIGTVILDSGIEGGYPSLTVVSGLQVLGGPQRFDVLALRPDFGLESFAVQVLGGRWLQFEMHRQHHAALGIGPFAPPPPAPPVTTLNPGQKFRARLCGQGAGGWKGSPQFVGVLMFSMPTRPQQPVEQISFWEGFEGHAASGKSYVVEEISAVSDGRFEVLLRQFPCLDENDEGEKVFVHRDEELVFEIHREDVAKATITSHAGEEAGVSPAAALADFSHEKPAPEPEVLVSYTPGAEEKAQVAFYERILNNQGAVEARQHARAMAVAILRFAVQHPGQAVGVDMQAPLARLMAKSIVPNDRLIRQSILSFAKTTGLLPFLVLGRDTVSVVRKEEAKDAYAYAKGIEPFLLPVEQMKLSLPAKEYAVEAPLQMDKGLQEALELTRRVNQG